MLTKLKGAILLATNNPGKLLELQQLLAPLENVRLLTPKMLGIDLEVAETGSTYQENAALKAEAFAKEAGILTLADDSGLEVDALDGAPGIHSKRYSPQPGATDGDRRALMVSNLQGKPRPWTARFRACVALSAPELPVQTMFGACEGEIIPEERGTNGFGYDPIFYIPDLRRTMAELTDEQKNAVSHRGNAVRAAMPLLVELLKES